MQGVIGVRPSVSRTKKLESFLVRWKKFQQENPDIVDATLNILDYLEAIGVSENGQNLVKALSSTRFRGLTTDYSFVDDQLQSLAF
ncbi:hypothetical protein QYF36_022130 [Acer negundo]|nr:hypothetical protein QYF36_003965 [Acer negundo]KAK4840948.1 hypothetical protein QYF36_022130 [Acer negundo]